MSKVLYCKDVGFDCGFVARADDETTLLQEAARHAGEEHGITDLTPDVVAKVRAAIRDE